jgi:hypothetical protein
MKQRVIVVLKELLLYKLRIKLLIFYHLSFSDVHKLKPHNLLYGHNFNGLSFGSSKKQVPIKPHTKVRGGTLFF